MQSVGLGALGAKGSASSHGEPLGDSDAAGRSAYLDRMLKDVSDGGAKQAGAAGDISPLTKGQALATPQRERLTDVARRSAGLAFKGQNALLHAEFKVGVHEPQDLASELERAEIIHASAVKYATQLAKHGWIAQDAVELDDNIKLLGGKDEDQEAGKDEKKGITAARNRQTNLRYTASSPPKTPPAWPTPAPGSAWSKASRKPAPASSSTSSRPSVAAPTSHLPNLPPSRAFRQRRETADRPGVRMRFPILAIGLLPVHHGKTQQ